MIAIERLSRRFGDFELGGISLSIGSGEYWVVLGPSGSGKSLLLETLAGFHVPDCGTIHLDGRDVTDVPPEQRGVGFVFQKAALFPHYSVRGNIEYGLRVRHASPAARRRRVDEVIERLDLGRVLPRPVATLSGGEAQRVAIARALAISPSLLLLDEPLSMLDHNARLELQLELKRIHTELRTTPLHVTHSREEAEALGDHCALLLGGNIVQDGTFADLQTRPRCPFVARFLGLDPKASLTFPPCAPSCLERPGRCRES
jgi:ABC-type Fe3+/spermidine/putrescine transport system ATPase subunit